MTDREFWQYVYIAAIRAGKTGVAAREMAKEAVVDFTLWKKCNG